MYLDFKSNKVRYGLASYMILYPAWRGPVSTKTSAAVIVFCLFVCLFVWGVTSSFLISNPCKIMLRVILNRLKAKAEELLAEEQAGVRPGRRASVFNSQVITGQYLQHQRHVYHSFIDFKEAFDRAYLAGPWQVSRSFNTEEDLVQAI